MKKTKLPLTNKLFTNQTDDVVFYSFPEIDAIPFVKHGFSTRLGGVSPPPFNSMNLGYSRGDADDNVTQNYKNICSALGLHAENLVISSQQHNTNIMRVTPGDRGKGYSKKRDYSDVDGLVTKENDVVLSTLYADCVPLFFVDPVNKAVGVAHAGWQGTVKKIGECMVNEFEKQFDSNPAELIVAIGPSIGPCCFEVGDEVAEVFKRLDEAADLTRSIPERAGKFFVDLWEVNRQILISSGVATHNIITTDLCTKCHSDVLWSHRVSGVNRGSSAAIISLI